MASSYEDWWAYTTHRIQQALEMVAYDAQAYAKMAHPWTNRTGDAEGGLTAVVEGGGRVWRMVISHGVSHGFWLEVKYGGKWGIIPDTVDLASEQAGSAIQGILR
jgi:hypothetical protein